MLELYLAITLFTFGIYLSNEKQHVKKKTKRIVNTKANTKETFVGKQYYNIQNAEHIEKKANIIRGINPEEKTNNIRNPLKQEIFSEDNNTIISKLTGQSITKEDFSKRDDGKILEPFFGKNITQNTSNLDIPNRLLEPNGMNENFCKKKEIGQFFAPTGNLSFVNGTPSNDESIKDRFVNSNIRNNELPFEQTKIAPGIGQEYGNDGVGGFHQVELQEIIKPKNIDELRAINNPKITYKGRTISGKRIINNRGKQGTVAKNRPETYYKNSPDRYFTTTGDQIKPKADENYCLKNTNRQKSRFFVGGLKRDTNKEKQNPNVKQTTKNIYKTNENIQKTQIGSWNSNKGNYNKTGYKAYPNERDTTQMNNYSSNLLTHVKSLITPIQDAIRKTKKENVLGNSRPEGNMTMNNPKKPTVYDPNDIAKTTIKETTIHNNRKGQMGGLNKLTVYDPNDIARTTIKETTIHNNRKGSMNGPNKLTVYDPNDVAKTTLKETMIHNKKQGTVSMQQPSKNTIGKYDTPMKVTLRNTLKNWDYNKSLKPIGPNKLQTFNKKNPPKTTIKETTVTSVREGHINISKDNGYLVKNMKAPNTSRQFLTDYEYEGIASCSENGGGGGYMTSNPTAPNTSKQFLSDNEYKGNANSKDKKSISYDSAYMARLNINKEVISKGRKPTQNNVKVSNGSDTINTINKKQMSGVSYPKINKGVKFLETMSNEKIKPMFSHNKDTLNQKMNIERINPEILDSLKDNPFAKSITSTGPEPLLKINMDNENTNNENAEREKKEKSEQDRINEIIRKEIDNLN